TVGAADGNYELVGVGAFGRLDVPLDDGALAGGLLGGEAFLHGVEHLAQHRVDAGRLDELVDLFVGPALEELGQGLGIVRRTDLIAHWCIIAPMCAYWFGRPPGSLTHAAQRRSRR